MRKFNFAAAIAAGAALALSPAVAVAQDAAKPVVLGVKIQMKEEGPEVVEMIADATGASVGFKVGDILLEAGGKPISAEVLQEYLKQAKAGDQVSFKVKRAGAVVDLTGKAVAAPDGWAPPPPQPEG